MTGRFVIDASWIDSANPTPEHRVTTAEILISVNGVAATRVEDRRVRTVRETIRVSSYALARWLLANWWRLRWEAAPTTTVGRDLGDWRMSHALPAAGGGFVWPPLLLVSTGAAVEVSTLPAKGRTAESPLRYLESVNATLSAEAFEAGVGDFLKVVLARLDAFALDDTDLHDAWRQLARDRKSRDRKRLRRLEARFGLDPDDDGDRVRALMEAWRSVAGADALEEIAAATDIERVRETLGLIETSWQSAGVVARIAGFDRLRRLQAPADAASRRPWTRAYAAARHARAVWQIDDGPLDTPALGERLGMSRDDIEESRTGRLPFPIAADGDRPDSLTVAFNRSDRLARRFDLARVVADHVFVSRKDRWHPATQVVTDRQQFQRAFAAELLCPASALRARVGERPIYDDDVREIAEDFMVSPYVVDHQLENHRLDGHRVSVDGRGARPLHLS